MRRILTTLFLLFLGVAMATSQEQSNNNQHISYKLEDGIIYQSNDGEITWEQLPQQPENITMIAWAKLKPERVFAATESSALIRLYEGEKTWISVFNAEQGSTIEDMGFTRNTNIAWLTVTNEDESQIQNWLSMDGGMTWTIGNGRNSKLHDEDENTIVVFSDTNKSRKGAQEK
ncbi:MAG: hypothetical protein HYZ34_02520 [Ignavibacteriae bacterium]|nr:hypothetical protein [Ignavibacteriota bacterium]